jgi:ATP-dependent DNA ligase
LRCQQDFLETSSVDRERHGIARVSEGLTNLMLPLPRSPSRHRLADDFTGPAGELIALALAAQRGSPSPKPIRHLSRNSLNAGQYALARLSTDPKPCSKPPGFILPCQPALADRPPSGPGWQQEIKWDGYRFIARKDGNRVRLWAHRTIR